jgi:hypothetical protein
MLRELITAKNHLPPNHHFWLVACLRVLMMVQVHHSEILCKRMSWMVAQTMASAGRTPYAGAEPFMLPEQAGQGLAFLLILEAPPGVGRGVTRSLSGIDDAGGVLEKEMKGCVWYDFL